ncbi:hypothetical protein ACHAWU_009662 [Discostella pseudostelligera]|uniref:FAD/NAD(P)-binding domain-containing protein n=1 Tax=Discostella pseudostelligera TaxID=259834 RepID=A0ABD3N3V9_9STRA
MMFMHRLLTRHANNSSRNISSRAQQQQQQQQQHVAYIITSAGAAAASCLVAATALSSGNYSNCEYDVDEHDDDDDGGDDSNHCSKLNLSQCHRPRATANYSIPTQQDAMILASSPTLSRKIGYTSKTAHSTKTLNKMDMRTQIVCDYAIIGHGKAGRSAARTIHRLDPTANIVIIDPNHNNISNNIQSIRSNGDSAVAERRRKSTTSQHQYYLQSRANFIDHAHKLIHVHPTTTVMPQQQQANHDLSSSDSNNNNIIVHYRKSALLATGSRGAPPPEGCIRDDARSRILELRSTTLPPPFPLLKSSSSATKTIMQQSTMLPILDPLTVRSLSSMAVSQGATIAIMGSGFEALELAAHCARIATASSSSSSMSNRMQTNVQKEGHVSNDGSSNVKLLFGNSSPMSNRLPRYLGVAVTKRLRQHGIDVEDRTLTRYIAMNRPMVTPENDNSSEVSREASNHPPQLEIYTVKSYDHMDTKRLHSDLLVLAPSVDGLNGTAVIPTLSSSSLKENHDASSSSTTTGTDYSPWSSLISPPLLTCYRDDGRIATNAELNAASSLYAAGSVARYPNLRTGRAEVSGGRHVSSEQAGEVAARNMVGTSVTSPSMVAVAAPCYMKESIPVWRSDVIPYVPVPTDDEEADIKRHLATSTLALYSMGIHALCVGRCDAEGMATHGFWWTNQSTTSSNGRLDDVGKSLMGPNAFMRRATRRMTNSSSNAKSSSRGSLPVYGSGVVFYLDRSGNVGGIMLWGLPYTTNPKDVQSHDLNTGLIERMKSVIRSNGGVSVTEHSESILRNHPGMNMDIHLLSYLHFAEESKYLATFSLMGTPFAQGTGTTVGEHRSTSRVVLGRPLHRYTPIKPAEMTNVGKMHRKNEAGHATEEDDVFYSSMESSTDVDAVTSHEPGRPPSLKRIYPIHDMMSLAGTERYSIGTTERERRRMQLERSRPPKEEPLWMRHGDEHRFVSKRDVMVDSFLRNIQSGRFSDGSDALKQAPVPKFYVDAKEKWNTWNDGADNETDDVEEQ